MESGSISGPTTLSAVGETGDLANIDYVGFTNLDDVTGNLSSFSLTEIPEPASFALLLLGGVAVLGRHWSRRR